MQTFLPYSKFTKCAAVLDRQRLGKQRVEGWQILNILLKLRKNPKEKIGWMNHPAVRMWKNSDFILALYTISCCAEWTARGYKDTINEKILNLAFENLDILEHKKQPSWLGNEKLHASHRAALLAKNPEWYQQFGWKEEPKIEYFWP